MPPKITPQPLACLPRSAVNTALVIDSLEIETNERYKPQVFPGQGKRTKCNKFSEDFADSMGVHLPKGLLAKVQIEWLSSPSAGVEGWFEAKALKADEYADKGWPVLVCWTNPDPTKSSHIAAMRKAKTIAQAGASCFSSGSIARGFGKRPVRYFAHA